MTIGSQMNCSGVSFGLKKGMKAAHPKALKVKRREVSWAVAQAVVVLLGCSHWGSR